MIELPHLGLAAEKKDSTPFLMGFPNSVATLVGGFMLTQERLKEVLTYNPQTGFFTRNKTGGPIGCANKKLGYYQIGIDYKRYYAHRLAWLYMYGEMPNKDIDHINNNGFDNSINNLRTATRKENIRNSKHQKNNTSGYKGVIEIKGKWRAAIKVDRKNIYLGMFSTAEEAHRAYCNAADFYFKEFANYGRI
jgi:hypothetical protein